MHNTPPRRRPALLDASGSRAGNTSVWVGGWGCRGKDADSAEAPTVCTLLLNNPNRIPGGLFLLQAASWGCKILSPARTQNTTSSRRQVKPCKASQASLGFTLHRMGERSTNKAGQPLLPPGAPGGRALHLHGLRNLQVQVTSWGWLQGLRPSHPR